MKNLKDSLQKPRIGFIGAGKMGGAMLKKMCEEGPYPRSSFNVYDHHPENYKNFGINLMADAKKVVAGSDIIFIAVKPQQVPNLLQNIRNNFPNRTEQVVVSICAGISINYFERNTIPSDLSSKPPRAPVVRTLPTITCSVGKGATLLAHNNCSPSHLLHNIECLLQTCGSVHFAEETHINSLSAISGSGPAFISHFLESLVEGAILNGIKRETALALALETMEGTVALLKEGKLSPSELKTDVASPGGTTIAGLYALEKSAFKYAVMNCLSEAKKRAEELGS